MASVDASASLFGSGARVSVKAVPPPVWVALAVIVGAGILLYHTFANTPDDVSWTDPEQPPINVPLGPALPALVSGTSWGTAALRGRAARRHKLWPADTDESVAGGAWNMIPTSGRPEATGWAGAF